MQSNRLLKATSSRSICVFCLHRLRGQATLATARQPQKRNIGGTPFVRRPANQAVAERDDESNWYRQSASQSQRQHPVPSSNRRDFQRPRKNFYSRTQNREHSGTVAVDRGKVSDVAAAHGNNETSIRFNDIRTHQSPAVRKYGCREPEERGQDTIASGQWQNLRRRGEQNINGSLPPGRQDIRPSEPRREVEGAYRRIQLSEDEATRTGYIGLTNESAPATTEGGNIWWGEVLRNRPDPNAGPRRQTDKDFARKLVDKATESSQDESPSLWIEDGEAEQDTQSTTWRGDGFSRARSRAASYQDAMTYDATPLRRNKGVLRAAKRNRRAEKFDTSDQVEGDEDPFRAKEKEKEKQRRRAEAKAAKEAAYNMKKIELPAFISVANLASALKVRLEPFTQKLEELGFEEVVGDHFLNFENASLIASEYNYEPTTDRSESEDLRPRPAAEDQTILPPRPPVVTIMGHVDHGKTTLLDYLRQSSVAATEHGGITQHIGAFSVPMASGKLVTFLDTPGHAAFLSMRQRGANVTDIVVLVVAADDGVMPQTVEAIKHAKAAKVPIIVAINKIDKEESNIERVKQDLLRHEVEVEDFQGDVQAIPVSGKTGLGLDELEEAIVTQAEILDMRAEDDGPAEGWVLEATTKKAGRIATVLVRRGTLRTGDVIVAGSTWARVRSLRNEAGVVVQEAGPGTPVEVDGWRDQPLAGDEVLQAPSERKAASVVEYRESKVDEAKAAVDMEAINEFRRQEAEKREKEKAEKKATKAAASSTDETEEVKQEPQSKAKIINVRPTELSNIDLYFIIKADVSGSAEAIEGSVAAIPLSNHPVTLHVLRTGVGQISEFDIEHLSAVPRGCGILVSFNQNVPNQMIADAESVGVRVLDQNIIYKVIDDVRGLVEEKLPPIVTQRVTGEAELAQVFDINVKGRKYTKVAGCRVRNGIIVKGKKARVFRGGVGEEGELVYDGFVSSLKSHKKDVAEMRKGSECGMGFESWEGFQAGDVIQCYEEASEPRRLPQR